MSDLNLHQSILSLLDKRKEEGWSVEARAILFSEWMAHSLYVIENDQFPNHLPESVQIHAKLAQTMREFLSLAQEHDFVGSTHEQYNFMARMSKTLAGDNPSSKMEMAKNLLKCPYDQAYNMQHLVHVISGSIPETWKTISEMGMDEEDLSQYIASKIPQAHNNDQETHLDRMAELETLKQQMKDCDIPAMMFDALTFESTTSLEQDGSCDPRQT